MIDIASFIPEELKEIAKLFPEQAPLYVVGGFVRDAIQYNTASQDIDVASALTPPELAFVLKGSKYSLKAASLRLGTMIIKGERSYEYTAFRVDSYPDGVGNHSPQEVIFTRKLEKDARRRDFKCNAIYYDIRADKLVDPLGGIQEIQNKVLSTTIEPDVVLSQDGLRIMRLARMISVHGYTVEESTKKAAKILSSRLRDISIERITTELIKILLGDNVYAGLSFLREIGAWQFIIPELAKCEGVEQNPKYHKYDVMEHTFKTVENAPKKIRIAALVHDIAKPVCQENDGNMYKHDIIGAEMAKKILKRMKFPNQIIDDTAELVGTHMFDLTRTAKKATIRRFIAAHADKIPAIVALQKADALATGMVDKPQESRIQAEFLAMKDENVPLSIKEMKYGGTELAKIGFRGKEIGVVLDEMFDNIIIGCIKNDKEVLDKYAKKKWEKLHGNSNSNN